PNRSLYLPDGFAGVGNDKATRIWYRAITTYLTSFSDYHDARVQTLRACADLYGASSAEYAAVENAFAAINVGPAHGQPPRPEVRIDVQSPYFDGYNSGLFPNLIRFVPAGQTTPDPVLPVQVLNTSDQAVSWSVDGGGQISADGRYTASKRIYGYYPVEVKSQADPLEHARGLVANVDIDVNDDTEVDAMDLGNIALAYGSSFWWLTPPTRYDQKADLDASGILDDFDIEMYLETFRAYTSQ
ncbi:MAG: M4 family metallopeptidase, partial [Proteobacteria bacterium]|nr:M4 family metallopeptidase [Pseudomonadota bacterium]